jgi:hypothetical protein
MSEAQQVTAVESRNVLDGDRGMNGVNDAVDPGYLSPNLCAYAENMRFRNGSAFTRKGIRKLRWMENDGVMVFPFYWPLDFSKIGDLLGTGRFRDPDGYDWVLLAGNAGVYAGRPGLGLIQKLACEQALTGPVWFVQAFNKVLMFRGESQPPMVLESIDTGFTVIDTTKHEDGTTAIPNSFGGTFFQNRIVVPYGRDMVGVSVVGEYTRFVSVLNAFRVNEGSEDQITCVFPMNQTTMLVSKERSLFAISNLIPTTDGRWMDAVCNRVTLNWGFVAPKTVVQVGQDVIGLSKLGVMSVVQTEQGKVQGVDVALSAKVPKLFRRINWDYVSDACAEYHDNKYYLAVPIDGSTTNNAIFVFDFLNGEWCGLDRGDAIDVVRFFRVPLRGIERLCFLDSRGWMNMMDEGRFDEVDGPNGIVSDPITSMLVTRQYGLSRSGLKRWGDVSLDLSTWGVNLTVSGIADGVNESRVLVSGWEPMASKSMKWRDKLTALMRPKRKDYVVKLGNGLVLPSDGITLEEEQRTLHRYRAVTQSRTMQIKAVSTSGILRVHEVSVEGTIMSRVNRGSYG